MKHKAIIVLANSKDSFKVINKGLDTLFLNSITEKEKSKFLKHNIIRLLLNNFSPTEQMLDFLNLAVAVYSADQLIARDVNGYLGWNRMIEIFLPVIDLQLWENQIEDIQEMLSFLSGDKWILHVRPRMVYEFPVRTIDHSLDRVALFSGGLDSYIGAIDMLSEKQKVAFVGHHKSGGTELPYQEQLMEGLREVYPDEQIKHFFFYVQPEKVERGEGFSGESSQRARSILFLALGLAVANSYGKNIDLVVPENGLISLNVPLTKSRIGSLSTRTTHPYFFFLLNKCLLNLGIENRISNPYRFSTKGEMFQACKNQKLLKGKVIDTISCSKPGHYKRWHKGKHVHCGHCAPCLIRRASMAKVGFDDGNNYEFDIIRNPPEMGSPQGIDCNAFKSALERIRIKNVSLLDIAISGPLPGEDQELRDLKMVYIRGMKEVKDFFQGK